MLDSGAIKQLPDGKFHTKLAAKTKWGYRQEDTKPDTLRNCAKKITLNALYSSLDSPVTVIKDFLKLFPSVAKILESLKKVDYKDLALLMQRIEAKCILDHCSKNIAKKHPKLPLICRHDSLSTTFDLSIILKQEFTMLLKDYFGIEVKVDISDW